MRIAVGLSGGVDSAVAALMLKKQGWDVGAYTMYLGRDGEDAAVRDTQELALRLGIPLKVVDLSKQWQENVCGYVRTTMCRGETPNPCVRCNETVKMFLMPQIAFADGFDRFATGHYAKSDADGRLFRARYKKKDQSYFLYRIPPELLSRIVFPRGDLDKSEVRKIALDNGFSFPEKSDSQDFCGGDVKAILGAEPKKGEIVTLSGKIIGEHQGYWNYTVGMRKGLGIGGGVPYYVAAIDAGRNRVVVGHREEVLVKSFALHSVVGSMQGEVMVKVRSAGEPKGPVNIEGDRVFSSEGMIGVSPGQSAVFFRGEEVVGGGIIAS